MRRTKLILGYLLLILPLISVAEEVTDAKPAGSSLSGIKYGIGISLSYDVFGDNRVVTASLDENGIVRVSDEQTFPARIVLESHYFFPAASGKWGHGPFVAVQPGSERVIEAVGGGWMAGFLKNRATGESWNIGVGLLVTPSVRVLGDSITANKALPTNETTIRYKYQSQIGGLAMISFTF